MNNVNLPYLSLGAALLLPLVLAPLPLSCLVFCSRRKGALSQR